MHLFKNKTKDVKQFLQEMKANKTNRSSNLNSLQKSNKRIISPAHSQDPHHTNSVGNLNKPNAQSRRSSVNSIDSRESIKSINGSTNSNSMRFNSGVTRFIPSPPQPVYKKPIYGQPHFSIQQNRHISSQAHQYSHNYPNNVSQIQNYDYDLSNQSTPIYPNQRQFNSFDDGRNFHIQPYQNISQPMRPQSFVASHDSFGFRKNPIDQQNFSQNSNSTVYETSQQYQNYISSHQKPFKKSQQTNYITQASNNHKKNKKNQNAYQKSHFNNSQQLNNNRFNQQKSFTSQVSNFDYQMQQISEAEPGLSTQKDSPAKISEFFSKNKNSNFKQTPIRKITQSNIFQIFQDQINGINSQQNIQKTDNFENASNEKLNNKKPFYQPRKNELKAMHVQTEQENEEKTKKIQVSDNQKFKLNKSLHQIHDTYLELDKIFKQTSILFNNIQRASEQFNKKVKSNGKYFKYLGQNEKMQYQKMEIQESQKVDFTLKKQNKRSKMNHLQNQKTFKKDQCMKQFDI